MGTILRAVVGYLFLMVMVRVLRRRPGAQMTLAEFVLVFLIGGVIILATVGHDRSVTNCTCAVIAVGMMHRAVSYFKLRYPSFRIVVDGPPLVVVRKGEWQDEVLHQASFDHEDVMASARLNGVRTFEEIEYAVLERNGGISILQREKNDSGEGDGG